MNNKMDRVSKQALYQAANKLNPNVFHYLMKEFAKLFYQSSLVKKHKGFILLAEDGTTIQIPYSLHNINEFNFSQSRTVQTIYDVKTVVSKSAGLYDVTNGLFLDFSMEQAKCSETPLSFRHLYHTKNILNNNKVIYLADRYYGSVEIISTLESFEYNYCIRGKSYFYKKEVAAMTGDDEWIHVNVDKKWVKRFRYSSEAIQLREENPIMKIRVVKSKYVYQNKKGEDIEKELLFFTNLSEETFSTQGIIDLYTKRWDVEVSYKTLKSTMEWERSISCKSNITKCCIYGKILFFNIVGVTRKHINNVLLQKNEKQYAINITQLIILVRSNQLVFNMYKQRRKKIIELVENILIIVDKIKVPTRPDRHNQRWGRIIVGAIKYRFTLDGRNHPKLLAKNGYHQTIKP